MKSEMPTQHVATSNLNGHYLLGQGPHKVMVLHGWLIDSAGWAAIWDIADQEVFTWCFMDARGYGLSQQRSGDYTVDEIADDALELADALDWKEFSVVGHSMTGLAIQRVMLAAPERVRGLVGVAAVPATGGGLVGERRIAFDNAIESREARSSIVDFSTGNLHEPAWLSVLTEHSFRCSNPEALGTYLDSWGAHDFHVEVEGNPTEVGLIIGQHDPSLTAERMRDTWMQWYKNSTLKVVPNSGHYPMEEQPAAFQIALEELLAEHQGAHRLQSAGRSSR